MGKKKQEAKPEMHPPSSVPERLIREHSRYAPDMLTDTLMILARDVEDAMIQSGAVPGKDYTYLNIFELAVRLHAAATMGALAHVNEVY
jgi:hypothetical protein